MKPYMIEGKCKEWSGSRTSYGYGNVWHNGKTVYVHRLEWERKFGPILEGMCVLHKCDNPPCHNPDHLFLGTKHDNMLDKVSKGRNVNPNQRLTQSQVDEIRARLAHGETSRSIAKMFGVDPSNISHIKRGKSWH